MDMVTKLGVKNRVERTRMVELVKQHRRKRNGLITGELQLERDKLGLLGKRAPVAYFRISRSRIE